MAVVPLLSFLRRDVLRASTPTWTVSVPAAPMAARTEAGVVARISANNWNCLPQAAISVKRSSSPFAGRRLSMKERARDWCFADKVCISETTRARVLDRYPSHWRFRLQKAHPLCSPTGDFFLHQHPREISMGIFGKKRFSGGSLRSIWK